MSRSATTCARPRSTRTHARSGKGCRQRPRRRKARRRRSKVGAGRGRQGKTTTPGRLKRELKTAKERKARREVKRAYEVLQENVLALLSREEIGDMARQSGFSQREAKAIEPFEFVLSCVLASTIETKRGFAAVWRVFGAATGVEVARSAITQRFGKGSAELLRQVFDRAMQRVPASTHPELLGKLEQFSQVLAHDGSVLALSSLLSKMFPATRTNSVAAAAKVHASADVVNRRIVNVEITGERESELHVLWDQPIRPGALNLVDLGYYCHDFFGFLVANGAHVVSRLKDNAKPTILDVEHGVRAPRQSVGKRLDEVEFVHSRDTFDLLAEFSTSAGPIPLRVVGVRNKETGEYHCYVTDLSPGEFSPKEVAAIYSFRWIIELLFLQLKSFCHLDHVDTKDPDALRTHLYASLTASIIIHALLVASAKASGLHASDISHLTVAAAAPLLAMPLLLLWMDVELTQERLARMLIEIVAVGCRDQNQNRTRKQWGGLSGG
jgi:putative transposase